MKNLEKVKKKSQNPVCKRLHTLFRSYKREKRKKSSFRRTFKNGKSKKKRNLKKLKKTAFPVRGGHLHTPIYTPLFSVYSKKSSL